MIQSSGLNAIIKGEFLQYFKDLPISYLSTDSRKIINNESSVFFAIKGKIHDGHQYIDDLYNRNIRQFIIENKDFNVSKYPDANFFVCGNSIFALQELAVFYRQLFNIKILAITGSNGKTIVKEWLSQILSWKYNVVKSPKSYNSQIGVPLSIWQINESHNFGVFEAGISTRGEMARLEKIIKPDIGILTNIGSAHDEGFHSRTEKLEEKAQLFKNCKTLIYNLDDNLVHTTLSKILPECEKITWGSHPEAIFQIAEISQEVKGSKIKILHDFTSYEFNLKFTDRASIENIIHCIVYLLNSEWTLSEIQEGLDALHNISMRLEMKRGVNDTYLIDDTYNNDLAGLEIALNYLLNQKQRNKRSLILSDILQSGMSISRLYEKTAYIINQNSLDKVIGIGEEIKHIKGHLKSNFYWFKDTSAFLEEFDLNNFNNEIVLVKGARNFGLEKAIRYLQEKLHGTVLEINLDALSHNLNVYRSYLKPGTKIMVMVKALAYGSGSIEVANLLEFHRIDYLGVAYTDEGVTLRKNGINLPIMIMNPSLDSMDKILEFRLEPEIYNLRLLEEINRNTKINNRSVHIHIKLDTGMSRLGFDPEDLDQMISILKENSLISVASVFSHLSSADITEHNIFTENQARRFKKATQFIESRIQKSFIRHIANSAAIIRYPEYHFDMVRLGIGLYGFDATGLINDQLRSIGTLKTEVSQIKKLKKGDSVGYGRREVIEKDSTIATIAIGYADGFFRSFGNKTVSVWINGCMAPVLGNVCMDMTMIDITEIEAKEGDPVIIFGEEQPLKLLADSIHTIPYEILTNISERVKRIYISE
jgi:alanine racemase